MQRGAVRALTTAVFVVGDTATDRAEPLTYARVKCRDPTVYVPLVASSASHGTQTSARLSAGSSSGPAIPTKRRSGSEYGSSWGSARRRVSGLYWLLKHDELFGESAVAF